MKAIILDMCGVIVKQTGDDFAPYVKQTFPELTIKEIHQQWFRADMGEISSLDVCSRWSKYLQKNVCT